jgi:hypothetical protein
MRAIRIALIALAMLAFCLAATVEHLSDGIILDGNAKGAAAPYKLIDQFQP